MTYSPILLETEVWDKYHELQTQGNGMIFAESYLPSGDLTAHRTCARS